MSTTTTTLPTKPSELIRVALADLRECEADDRYRVDMWDLHSSRKGQRGQMVCHVCLAGAVLAQTLGAPRNRSISGRDLARYRSSVQDRLRALDYFRRGEIKAGLSCLRLTIRHEYGLRALDCFRARQIVTGLSWLRQDISDLDEDWGRFSDVSGYDASDPDEFHDRMHRLANFFESHGL